MIVLTDVSLRCQYKVILCTVVYHPVKKKDFRLNLEIVETIFVYFWEQCQSRWNYTERAS